MIYYRVNNLIKQNGEADYKGLDVDRFIYGTQYYEIVNDNYCVLATDEEVHEVDDVIMLSEEEYSNEVNIIQSAQRESNPTIEDELNLLNGTIMELTSILASLQGGN